MNYRPTSISPKCVKVIGKIYFQAKIKSYDLLLEKLLAYSVGFSTLMLTYSYLAVRKQRTETFKLQLLYVGKYFISSPKGFTLGPLSFGIFYFNI